MRSTTRFRFGFRWNDFRFGFRWNAAIRAATPTLLYRANFGLAERVDPLQQISSILVLIRKEGPKRRGGSNRC